MKRISLLLLASAVLSSCGGGKTEVKTEQELIKLKAERGKLDDKIRKLEAGKKDSSKAIPVSVLEVAPQNFTAFVEVQGTISGEENVQATSKAPGTVTRILVQPGQRVGRGQVLAVLDAGPVEQQIQSLSPQISMARTMYDKQQRLWAQQIGTEVQLIQARTQYETLLKQRSVLQSQKSLYQIVSPISGVVDDVNIKVGEMANPGVFGIRVVSFDKLKAEAMLGENYLGKVKQGDPVTILLNESGDSIKTKLSYVGQAVEPISRSFPVQVRLGANNKLHPNMSCRIRIANYENSGVITIPVSVIQKTNAGDIVYVAQGNKAKAVTVTTGRTSNGQVEVLAGLNPGDRVITEGFLNLSNDMNVTVQ